MAWSAEDTTAASTYRKCWLTKGFDTADIQEAKALLDVLVEGQA